MREITPVSKKYDFFGALYEEDDITELLPEVQGDEEVLMESFLTPIESREDVEELYEINYGRLRTLTMNEMDMIELGTIRHGRFGIAESVQEAKEGVASKDRITLLARKYAQTDLSMEDEARLAIVTERLRRLVPRVTVEDFTALETIASFIQRMDSEHEKIRSRRKKK